ncbi:UDP-glycosyltransferase 74F2-like isoform X1 [Prunus avium]|uniref:Glycosyltransferase n=1 Tax=Prunus avium TaxID=42229 RepID=A0A6P5TQT1_PRUAV|nr:UDP-glycosyltransferase 74F2-like isoform X1 [Prunus avium]
MEKRQRSDSKAHCLVFPYPNLQGHINPMLQFSKLLHHKGVKVTLVSTIFAYNKLMQKTSGCSYIPLETISDGHDQGGSAHAQSVEAYLERFWQVGSQTLAQLIEKLLSSEYPVDCIVYDSMMPWSLDVAKKYGIVGASFFTQSCAVDSILYHVHKGLFKLPVVDDQSEISLPGLPPLKLFDMPSFVYDFGSYPAIFKMVVGQFSNVEKADWVLCNTFYELEKQVVDWMATFLPLKTIGPTIPSHYLDKRLEDDKQYGVSLFNTNNDACMKWLNEQPKGSVAYVAFGSAAQLGVEQMEELAWGLRRSKSKFLWVVREAEAAKLPKGFVEETSEKGLVVSWCPQLEVLANEAVGCFISHCGWNSTLEAFSLGVPVVALPQWTDQSTNAKFIMDVWKIGVKALADEKGVVRQEEVEHCISEIMEEERGKEMQRKALEWKELARKAVDEGGSSSNNIDEFISNLVLSREKRCACEK